MGKSTIVAGKKVWQTHLQVFVLKYSPCTIEHHAFVWTPENVHPKEPVSDRKTTTNKTQKHLMILHLMFRMGLAGIDRNISTPLMLHRFGSIYSEDYYHHKKCHLKRWNTNYVIHQQMLLNDLVIQKNVSIWYMIYVNIYINKYISTYIRIYLI